MRSAAAGTVVLVVAVVALAGCGGPTSTGSSAAGSRSAGSAVLPSSSAAGPTVPAVEGITAEAVRLRTDEAIGGQVQVRLTDTGTAPFTVTAVAIDSPGFVPQPPTVVGTTYAPGQTIDLPTPFGAVDCAAGADPAAARLTVSRAGGPAEDLRVPLAGGTLALVHGEECAAAAVRKVVDISLTGLTGAPDGRTLTGTVVLSRRSAGDRVRVEALGRSVLMAPVVARELPAALQPADSELALPVTFGPATCDAHVLAETKKPFVFPLSIAVGNAAPVPVDLPVEDAQKAVLQQLVDRVCSG
jgi:hypothetical protein